MRYEELVMAIGKYKDLGLKGLPKLIKQNSGRLPLNKYLSEEKELFD